MWPHYKQRRRPSAASPEEPASRADLTKPSSPHKCFVSAVSCAGRSNRSNRIRETVSLGKIHLNSYGKITTTGKTPSPYYTTLALRKWQSDGIVEVQSFRNGLTGLPMSTRAIRTPGWLKLLFVVEVTLVVKVTLVKAALVVTL